MKILAADGSALNETYAYDSMGRRVLADADGTQTVYVYDGAQVIAEYSLVGTTLTLQKRFIYGPGIDEPVCMITYAAGSESGRYFYHFDGQGNVMALSDSSGNVVEEYVYDVYGSVLVNGTYDRSQVGNPYLFTGRRWDGESGLYYYRARMYSPFLGRFLQPDLIGYADGMNMYSFCGNNPLNFIDPWGLCTDGDIEETIVGYTVLPASLDPDTAIKLDQVASEGIPSTPPGIGVTTLVEIIHDIAGSAVAMEAAKVAKGVTVRQSSGLKRAYLLIQRYKYKGPRWYTLWLVKGWKKDGEPYWEQVTGGKGWDEWFESYTNPDDAYESITTARLIFIHTAHNSLIC